MEDHPSTCSNAGSKSCHNASTLLAGIKKLRYRGGRSMLARYVSRWRKTGKPAALQTPKKISPKHAAIHACQPDNALSTEQRSLLAVPTGNCPELGLMRALAQDFRSALFGNYSSLLLDWIRTAKQCGIGSPVRFAHGMNKDLAPSSLP